MRLAEAISRDNDKGLEIEIFYDRGFSAEALVSVIDSIAEVLIGHINSWLIDEEILQGDELQFTLNKLFRHKRSLVVIKDVSKASFLIEVGVLAGGRWLLDKTIGATLSEAWKASTSHTKLLELLKVELPKILERRLGRKLKSPVEVKETKVKVDVDEE